MTNRDALIEQLMRELIDLKEKVGELEGQHRADEELMVGMRERVQQLEMELADFKDIAEQTCSVSVCVGGCVSVHFITSVCLCGCAFHHSSMCVCVGVHFITSVCVCECISSHQRVCVGVHFITVCVCV